MDDYSYLEERIKHFNSLTSYLSRKTNTLENHLRFLSKNSPHVLYEDLYREQLDIYETLKSLENNLSLMCNTKDSNS